MASNEYAKSYKNGHRARREDEFAFISYMDEANSFSVVSVKRLFDIDRFGKGSIREKNKTYRIAVEQTGNDHYCIAFTWRLSFGFEYQAPWSTWNDWQKKQKKVQVTR